MPDTSMLDTIKGNYYLFALMLLAAVASSLLFGYAHYYEGLNAVISISLLALLFVSIYLLSRKNIWALIIIHSAYDVFAFIAIFYS